MNEQTKKLPGYVYLMANRSDGTFKIGCSRWPEDRRKTVSLAVGQVVELVCKFQTPAMHETENYLHKAFAHRRTKGEWFSLTEEEVSLIRSIRNNSTASRMNATIKRLHAGYVRSRRMLTVEVDSEFHHRLRELCALRGMKMGKLIESLIEPQLRSHLMAALNERAARYGA